MTTIEFEALDYRADRTFVAARYRFAGDPRSGWRIERDGAPVLHLGPGYRLLRTIACGVCSTDLARHHLPFPLPQVTGHEVIGADDSGARYVVEINASHTARGVAADCAFCKAGLATHCPERLVLGIHDLPGGFGPWFLAPVGACVPLPAALPERTAVLVEPFAAALHAVHTIAPRAGDRIAVLGPRRLGMLGIAALAAVRAARAAPLRQFTIVALARDPRLRELARTLGADSAAAPADALAAGATFDVVVDTTGHPDGLADAVALASREVHLKSTHGRPACGVRHLTEAVVDELAIARFPAVEPARDSRWEGLRAGARPRIAWLAAAPVPAWLRARSEVAVGAAANVARAAAATDGLPRVDAAVVDTLAALEAAIRPDAASGASLVRPRGEILVLPSADGAPFASPLLRAIVARDLRLSTSRCGDFRAALDLLAGDHELSRLGERLVTHRFRPGDLATAFATAAAPGCLKAVVEHEPSGR
jgi:threonine dehydrogenase-like Zn-dependent dehydrogenase